MVIQAMLQRSVVATAAITAESGRIRLCKGAYREPGTIAFPEREEVDGAYAELILGLLRTGAYPALATHDEALIDQAIAVARAEGIAPDRFEFQMLYGVRRDLQDRLVRDGWMVRVYVPLGREWYPYFMRRLAERPANVAFQVRTLWQERNAAC